MKFKTFAILRFRDQKWTGAGIQHYDSVKLMDAAINKYCEENNLLVLKIDYSMCDENIVKGFGDKNIERRIYFVAGVSFKKNWFGWFRKKFKLKSEI